MDKTSSMAKDGEGRGLNNEGAAGGVDDLKRTLEPILVEGLAEIFVQKPADPIEYLGHWLLRERGNGEVKGQEDQALERAVQTRSTQTPDLQDAETLMSRNPFLIDIVIEVMLEEAHVNTLKTLRELNSNWNQLDLKELEKRAEKDQLKQLDFADEMLQEEFDRFLKDSVAIPQLFRSFRLNFPVPLKSIDFNFFKKYAPIFLQIDINGKIKTEGAINYLKTFLSWAAPTLQVLWVKSRNVIQDPVIPSNEPAQFGDHLVFHKLIKLICDLEGGMDHFNFKLILDTSETINPTPVLTNLGFENDNNFMKIFDKQLTSTALSKWSQLTKLTIMRLWNFDRIGPTLLSMGQAGMSLKELTLDLAESKERLWPQISADFSHFLETQAKSLQILNIYWDFFCVNKDAKEYVDSKINLPTFENLHTLQLYIYHNSRQAQVDIFIIFHVPVHFPKLDYLSVTRQGFLNMHPLDGEPIHLKNLFINDEPKKLEAWTCKFPSVESLTCKGTLFQVLETNLPWKKSLKMLEIVDGVSYLLKVSHLTNLRKIIVREWSFLNKFETYLAYFRQVLTLKLSSITFKSCEEPSNYIKARYIRHFPFPVTFEPMQFYDPIDHFPFRYNT